MTNIEVVDRAAMVLLAFVERAAKENAKPEEVQVLPAVAHELFTFLSDPLPYVRQREMSGTANTKPVTQDHD